jgi:hypothetical protein
LVVQYTINKHFAFSTGMKTAYLVGKSEKQSDANVYFVNTTALDLQKSELKSSNSIKSLGINRWDAAWISRFSYLPNKHININLSYDLGIFNMIQKNTSQNYNRYLGLNATYLF